MSVIRAIANHLVENESEPNGGQMVRRSIDGRWWMGLVPMELQGRAPKGHMSSNAMILIIGLALSVAQADNRDTERGKRE